MFLFAALLLILFLVFFIPNISAPDWGKITLSPDGSPDFVATNTQEEFIFVVYGDNKCGYPDNSGDTDSDVIHLEIINAIVGLDPQPVFVLNTGDMVKTGSSSTQWDGYDSWGRPGFWPAIEPLRTRPAAAGLPVYYFPVVGNHEDCGNMDSTSGCNNLKNHFTFLNSLPGRTGSEAYYSFVYGNSYFIIMKKELP